MAKGLEALPKRPKISVFNNIMLDCEWNNEIDQSKEQNAKFHRYLAKIRPFLYKTAKNLKTYKYRKLLSLRLGILTKSPSSVSQTTSNFSAIHSLSEITMKTVIAVRPSRDSRKNTFLFTEIFLRDFWIKWQNFTKKNQIFAYLVVERVPQQRKRKLWLCTGRMKSRIKQRSSEWQQ